MEKEGPLRKFLAKRKPLIPRKKLFNKANEDPEIKNAATDIPTTDDVSKPISGRTFEGQSDESYCLECLTPDTKLYTTKSVYPIVDLRPRYTVMDLTGEYNAITKRYRHQYTGDLMKIIFWYLNIPLRITPEHPVLGVRNLRKPQSIWQKHFNGGTLSWIEAGQLTDSDFIAFPRIRKSVDIGIITENLAELIGWYLAEGSCTEGKRGYTIEFSLGKHEKEYVKRIVSLLKSCFGYDAHVAEKKTAFCVQFSTLIFGRFFGQFGRKAHKKHLPRWFITLPENKQWRLLKGMVLGDGDVTKEAIRYSTVSENLAYDLRLLLFRLGLIHGIHYAEPRNSEINGRKIIGKYASYLFTIGGAAANKLAEKIDLDFRAKTDMNWGWIREDCILIPIRRIKKEHYEGIVYNLHVPPNESYTTLHGILHNCTEGHTMAALTEMRHAIDRHRTAGKMTPGVTEKVRVAIAELQGINEDVRSTKDASPEVKKGLDEILNEVRWIRKDYGISGKGLTRGGGSLEDLEELRKRIFIMQTKAYALVEKCPTCKKISRSVGERVMS